MDSGQPEMDNFLSGDGMNERNIRIFESLSIFDLLTIDSTFGNNDSFLMVKKWEYEFSITREHKARLIRNQNAICKLITALNIMKFN